MSPAFRIVRLFIALLRDRRGATAVEYGLIIALIVIGMFAGLRTLADATTKMWDSIASVVMSLG